MGVSIIQQSNNQIRISYLRERARKLKGPENQEKKIGGAEMGGANFKGAKIRGARKFKCKMYRVIQNLWPPSSELGIIDSHLIEYKFKKYLQSILI